MCLYDSCYDVCMTDSPQSSSEDSERPRASGEGSTGDPAAPVGAQAITTLESQAFFPADHAAVENGKVYASGAFWTVLRFPQFPAVLPAVSLVAVIRVPFHANLAEHSLAIGLVDQDEKAVGMRIEGMFRTAPTIEQKYGAPSLTAVAFPIHGLRIDRPGEYAFVLSVDGKLLDRYHFAAIQVANIAMMQPPSFPAQ